MNAFAVYAGAVALGVVVGAAGAALMLARARRGRLPVDLPDERRLHSAPTPRGGGIGVLASGAAALPLALLAGSDAERRLLAILVVIWALPNGILGAIDDHRPMRTAPKLGFQLACAAVAVALGLRVDEIAVPPFGVLFLGPLAGPFCVLWLVWLANVFNFMDGMDALAAGCGAIFAAGLAALALASGAPGHAALGLALSGALVGFLRYNAPPAKIFMGDGGSLFAGALLGGLALAEARPEAGGAALLASGLILGPFAWDATFTIARRLVRGEPMRPHRTHLYQRLALAGWPHGRVLVLYVATTILCSAAALTTLADAPAAQLMTLAVAVAGLLSILVLAMRAERRTEG